MGGCCCHCFLLLLLCCASVPAAAPPIMPAPCCSVHLSPKPPRAHPRCCCRRPPARRHAHRQRGAGGCSGAGAAAAGRRHRPGQARLARLAPRGCVGAAAVALCTCLAPGHASVFCPLPSPACLPSPPRPPAAPSPPDAEGQVWREQARKVERVVDTTGAGGKRAPASSHPTARRAVHLSAARGRPDVPSDTQPCTSSHHTRAPEQHPPTAQAIASLPRLRWRCWRGLPIPKPCALPPPPPRSASSWRVRAGAGRQAAADAGCGLGWQPLAGQGGRSPPAVLPPALDLPTLFLLPPSSHAGAMPSMPSRPAVDAALSGAA